MRGLAVLLSLVVGSARAHVNAYGNIADTTDAPTGHVFLSVVFGTYHSILTMNSYDDQRVELKA